MHGHIGERKEIPNYVSQTSFFAMQVLHLTKHCFYELHTNVSFSGEMVIYIFLLEFFSLSHQKE